MKPSLVIVGLGNPGKQYENTRHNVGFLAVDVLSENFGQGSWQDKQKFAADIQEARIGIAPVLLVKPKTYMNLSGDCVRKIVDFYKLEPANVLPISDDIDLPFAELRLRMKGGPGTHNGLRSIVETLGEDFPRLRIGLGQPPSAQHDLSSWVLSRFGEEQLQTLTQTLSTIPDMLSEFVLS